jgi:hypothetical protein
MKKIERFFMRVIIKLIGSHRLMVNLTDNVDRKLLSYKTTGYLHEIGWIKSFQSQAAVDKDNNPLPWITYSCIQFISERLTKNISMYEFGSGNSTSFFSKYVGSLTSVEHDKAWYEKVKKSIPPNVSLSFIDLQYGGEYSLSALKSAKKYNVIFVDGRDRVNCSINSFGALTADGVLVLDDSNRPQYAPALDFYKEKGFRRIDFWGTQPITFYNKRTSVFYRDANCFQI